MSWLYLFLLNPVIAVESATSVECVDSLNVSSGKSLGMVVESSSPGATETGTSESDNAWLDTRGAARDNKAMNKNKSNSKDIDVIMVMFRLPCFLSTPHVKLLL